MRRCAAMAEHRTLPARQHGRQPAPLGTQHAMPDRVHPAMHPMQPPHTGPLLHCPRPQPQRAQLRQRHHTPLTLGQLRNRPLQGWAVFANPVFA